TGVGREEASEAGRATGLTVVPGIEISAIYGHNVEVHVLGYFLDYRNPVLVEQVNILRDSRTNRARKMVEQLNQAGVGITFEQVLRLAQGGAIGRPHVARALCEMGEVSSLDAAFGKWLQEGAPGYVPRYKISPDAAVQLIIQAGGVACCAHPGKLKRDEILIELIEQGMRGIEVCHPDHGPATTQFYKKFAHKHDLIPTGGSDSHCIEGGKRTQIGSFNVPVEIVDRLKEAAGFMQK
ncbi:MAG: phosphatase, partial [Armatimonadetes bacterium]|nr:phosphatase [Armatimonadota bacterium]